MKKVSSWLLLFISIIFWGFRVVLAIMLESEENWAGFIVYNYNLEIALLFVTILTIMLVVRRKILGGIIYIITYGYYFGGYILNNFQSIISGENLDGIIIQNTAVAIVAIILALCTFIDILIQKVSKKKNPKTDWFFDNEKTDRKLDESADNNHYRIY